MDAKSNTIKNASNKLAVEINTFFSFKVYCDDFYFAPNCSTYCKSRDDSTGHYTCNYTLGRKVCREGWYGKDCLVYCRPRNDSSGHYMCNEMGQKLCLDGWIGGNCTQGMYKVPIMLPLEFQLGLCIEI